MSLAIRIAVRLTRGWVRLYTSRMPAELRETRRAEIDADLCDHENDARQKGMLPLVAATEILLRACLGVLDDLMWRFEAARARRATSAGRREIMMALSTKQIRWLGMCGLAGGILMAGDLIYFPRNDPTSILRLYVHIPMTLLLLAGFAGLWAQQRARLGKVGMVGCVLLFTSFVAFFMLEVLGLFGLRGDRSLANVLALIHVFLLPPGVVLLAIGLKGPVRVVAVAILGLWLLGAVLPPPAKAILTDYFAGWKNLPGFFVLAMGLALIGYFVVRDPAAGCATDQ